ncbi:hypothetical protein, partial [Candidatus Binatus sp.]|uniref:hypothetical protein n=1 Tax=Candidatus Binatus sp. TaxID=2811406 RepID=UPI002FD89F9A
MLCVHQNDAVRSSKRRCASIKMTPRVHQNEREIGMIAKISLTAAFFLIVAPPMACASNRDATNPAPMTSQAHESPLGLVVAQDDQPNVATSDNDNDNGNDSDSNDSADNNQNAGGDQ